MTAVAADANFFLNLAAGEISPSKFRSLSRSAVKEATLANLTTGLDRAVVLKALEDVESRAVHTKEDTGNFCFLALLLVFHYAEYPDGKNREKIDLLFLRHPQLPAYIEDVYQIPDGVLTSGGKFHDFGTTSIVLRCSSPSLGDVALKLLKPRYWGHASITAQVRTPPVPVGASLEDCAKILLTGDRWQAQQFIVGETLEKWVARTAVEDGFLEEFRKVAGRLLEVIEALYVGNPPHPHLDLNPKNILVRSVGVDGWAITLIDFGINYAITDRVGRPGQYSGILGTVAPFVAPQIVDGSEYQPIDADLYSYGMVLLHLLSRGSLNQSNRAEELSKLWAVSPTLAAICEDLVTGGLEASGIDDDSDLSAHFARLKRLVDSAFVDQIASQRFEGKLAKKATGPAVALNVTRFAFGSGPNPFEDIVGTTPFITRAKSKYLAYLATTSLALYYVILLSVLVLTVEDWKLSYPGPLVDYLHAVVRQIPALGGLLEYYASRFSSDALVRNLPGRLVCWSFGYIATNYYIVIYSRLYLTRRGDRVADLAEFVRAGNSLAYFFPIMVALYIEPQWWPFCVFAGILPVVLNNYCTNLYATRVLSQGKAAGLSLGQSGELFMMEYGVWAPQMLFYAVGCFILGGFLVEIHGFPNPFRLNDEFAYALIVMGINYFQIQRTIIMGQGPKASSILSRMSHWNSRNLIHSRRT